VPLTATRGRPVQEMESDRLVGALCAPRSHSSRRYGVGLDRVDEGRAQKRRVRAMRRQRARRL
jgi:hypothetical protein